MIQKHLYARYAETLVYSNSNADGYPVNFLHQGNWMGVLEEKGEWIHVITIYGEGWVRREAAEARKPGGLHIQLSEDNAVEYVNR